MKILWSSLIAVGLLLASRAAAADEEGGLLEHHGFAITVGAGVTGFADDTMRSATHPGGTWELRFSTAIRSRLAVEAGYVGSAQQVDLLGMDPDALLVGTGLEAAARVNLATGRVSPYVLIGAGWTHYDVTNADSNTSSMSSRDDVLAVPFGAGADVRFGSWILDARAVFRATFDNDLLPDSSEVGNPTRLDNWSALLRGGFEL